MKHLYLVLGLAAALAPAALAQSNPFEGRWDLTVTTSRDTYPDWIEIKEAGGHLSALIQPRSGSAHPATDVKRQGSHLTLTQSAATEKGPAVTWDLAIESDHLTGTSKRGDTVQGQLAGVRAPALKRPMPAQWTAPEPIFNGKDLTGWEPITPANNHWVVKDGELVNQEHGSNLRTTRKFDDFKLHIEYNCPDKGNSGIYLRGRYEVQVEYEPVDENDDYHSMGAIYSFLKPAVKLPRKPGTWESYDITLVGRWVTIVRDGVKTVDNQEIPGITGGALDSHEGEPGPFYIQGDHTGGLRYRNITISVPK
ncbi:MAG TPA: DUF1080 domain-containing protein [Bryobacteraceae bacterium]|nr:DUF1080 domain-containing protein [Bryobacteraceae bacterium]